MNTKIFDFDGENQHVDVQLINSDVYAGVNSLKNSTIQCAVTSPPYWGQRDYGFQGQIGNEKEYSEYIEKLEEVFAELRKKLDSKGIFFLNIGDKYLSRYGNSKLGMIPYKLAKFMKDNGWILVDTIIWYKPNHMPGSYTNRFTSTYEPIFVFAKNEINYYSEYVKKNKDYSNILKINLQPTPYNHVAVYPEKLIECLLKMGFPKDSTILDPFAGSGTTAKAVQNINQKDKFIMNTILIEASEEYVSIIRERCNISPMQKILKVPFVEYKTKRYVEKEYNFEYQPIFNELANFSKKYIIEIFDDDSELHNFIENMIFGNVYNVLNNTGIIYLGFKNNSIDNIHLVSTLSSYKWVIRNQIIVRTKKSWYPIYLIVKDTKRGKYHLNVDAVRIEHKDTQEKDWNGVDFLGYKVFNHLSNEKLRGIIVKIVEKYSDGMPAIVTVKWENGDHTNECIKHNGLVNESAFSFYCPKCKNKLLNYYQLDVDISCQNCNTKLWMDNNTIPTLKLCAETFPKKASGLNLDVQIKNTKKEDYNGKFRDAKPINFGASPGARSSTQETFFSVQRFFSFPQEMIADLLNLIIKTKKITKAKLTGMFPKSYFHTVGHWLRTDLGGSLPSPEDLEELNSILNIPPEFINLVNSRTLVLQTVKKSYKGKNPGDYLELEEKEVLNFLKMSAE